MRILSAFPRPSRFSVFTFLLAAVLVAACGEDITSPPAGDRAGPAINLNVGPEPVVTGQILGPDGASFCNTLPGGSAILFLGELIPNGLGGLAAVGRVDCPDDTYSLPVSTPGAYFTRLRLTGVPLGNLPFQSFFPNPPLGNGDVVNDLQVEVGAPLGGAATVDGAPVAGIGLTLSYDEARRFFATLGSTDAAGVWAEFVGRTPVLLQEDVRYRARFGGTALGSLCQLLGTRLVGALPAGGFLFPTEFSALDCTMETSASNAFAHDDTRLLVTPGPGDIGLLLDPQGPFGSGWGVQFPVAGQPVPGPSVRSLLFAGGLFVALENPDLVLSAVDVGAYALECGTDCVDFGPAGTVRTSRKKVTWLYDDGASAEGVGLDVTQESYDGIPPNDYVLFRFQFKNTSSATLTFWAGTFTDWDINVGQDEGDTRLNGALMFQTPDDGFGPYMGTLIAGDIPSSGNFFFPNAPVSLQEQVQAMTGALMRPTITGQGDIRYLHGAGPIVLNKKKSADVWIAIVGGSTEAELIANAQAAEADVTARILSGGDDDGQGGSNSFVFESVVSSPRAGGAVRPEPAVKQARALETDAALHEEQLSGAGRPDRKR